MNGNNSTIEEYIKKIREIDDLLQEIQRYYTPILVVLGLLGNCLSMCVFFGTKQRYSSSSMYLGVLAISDSGFLVTVFLVWLEKIKVNLYNRQGLCQSINYVNSFFSFLSVWLVVAFTVERYVAVRWPLRRQFLCTVARAKMAIMGLIALAVPLCSPVFLFSNLVKQNSIQICDVDKKWGIWPSVHNAFDTVITFAVPLTMIVIFNTLIARNIYKFDHVRRTLTVESDVSNERSHAPRDRMPQTKVTKMLLFVSSAFFCLNMPSFVLRVIAYLYSVVRTFRLQFEPSSAMRNTKYRKLDPSIQCFMQQLGAKGISNGNEINTAKFIWIQQMCNQLLFNTSFGINFFLYCVSGQNFRRALVRMFTKRSNTRRNGTLMQMANHGKQCEITQNQRTYSLTKRTHFVDNAQQIEKNSQETQKLSVNEEL